MDFIDIPPSASRLRDQDPQNPNRDVNHIRRASRIVTTLPHPPPPTLHRRTDSASSITSPTKNAVNLLPQMLLSTLPGPAPSSSNGNGSNPRATAASSKLLSARDPLSVPILTVNFKRFVERVGPIFWLQDRIEEIVLWKRGWKTTTVWIAAYAFFCYFPRLLLLLPQIALIGIMLATHPETGGGLASAAHAKHKQGQKSVDETPPAVATSTVDWQANIQAIQNLMGFVADAESLIQPYLPYVTNRSPYSPHILTTLFVSLLPGIVLVSLPQFPIRTVALVAGIGPLLFTHPWVSAHLPQLLAQLKISIDHSALLKRARARLRVKGSLRALAVRAFDDANLSDECWVAEMREVELYENERFGGPTSDPAKQEWSKGNLKDGERTGWTRGRDGWSGVGGSGAVSNLTFSLDPGWAFVTTEDWRADVEAQWARAGVDDDDAEAGDGDGWVYSNDAWTELRPPSASYAPSVGGVTRRRRWVRRIWYDRAAAAS